VINAGKLDDLGARNPFAYVAAFVRESLLGSM
jgi:hypothetical protein